VIIGTITIMRARPTARLGVAGRPERAADIEHSRGDNCEDEKRLDINLSLLHNLRSPFRPPHSAFVNNLRSPFCIPHSAFMRACSLPDRPPRRPGTPGSSYTQT